MAPQRRRDVESMETRRYLQPDRRDTSLLVGVTNLDRKPPHGTAITQLIIYIDEGFKARTGNIGKCPHCKRSLRIRLTAARLHT